MCEKTGEAIVGNERPSQGAASCLAPLLSPLLSFPTARNMAPNSGRNSAQRAGVVNVKWLAAALLLGFSAWMLLVRLGFFSSAVDLVANEPLTPVSATGYPWVETVELRLDSLIHLPRQYTGVIKAARTSEIGFKRTGRLERVFFQQGDRVVAGQVLAELDVEILNASRRELAAQLRGAQAVLQELVAGPRQQTIDLARTEVGDLQAQFSQAEIDLNRYQKLLISSAVSQQEFEEVRFRFVSIEERLKGAVKRLEELLEGTRAEKIEAQQAEVARLEAAVARLDVDIAESQLIVPYDGVISQRMFDEGAIVAAGAAVFRLVEQDRLEAWIGLPADLAASLGGDEVFRFQVNRATVFGRLLKVLPELDSLTRTQTVRFEILAESPVRAADDPASATGEERELPEFAVQPKRPLLVPGQLIRIELMQTIQQSGYWLPLKALAKGRKGLWTVYVAAEGESGLATLMQRDVEIIQVDSHRVYVRGALMEGERVVISGLNRLTPGQQVRVIPPAEQREETNVPPAF